MNEAMPLPVQSPSASGAARCWSCGEALAHAALFCSACRSVQPPRALDHFTRLGLSVDFALDENDLDRRYFSFQRQLHPDRFATRSARERAISQSQAVAFNEAYRVLKDPLTRADHLLKLKGIAANPDGCHTINDPTILMEQMERRENLSSAKTVEQAAAIGNEALSHVKESVTAIADAFHRDDLDAAGRETTRLKYLVKLVDEARGRKHALAGEGADAD